MRLSKLVRSNVARQLSQGGRTGETGAVAAIVGMLFGFGVLLGLGALVIDTGSLLFERRQLQSGADAAALSIAQTCAKAPSSAPCVSPSTSAPTLVDLAGANAADSKTDIASVCGSAAVLSADTSGSWTVCPTPGTPGLVECPSTSSTAKFVEVRTATRTGSGGTILPPLLAQTLAGGYQGETVKACARVAWGTAKLHPPIIPFTPSLCEWYKDTGGTAVPPAPGSVFPPNPPYDLTNSVVQGYEKALSFNAANDDSCAKWQGHNFPGGFGWLTHAGPPSCALTIPADHWVEGDTGIGAGNDCGSQIGDQVGHIVFLPLFDCADDIAKVVPCAGKLPGGSKVYYHLVKLAAFYMTAVDVTGQVNNHLPGYPTDAAKAACKDKGGKCIYGWFLAKTYDPGAEIDPTGDPTGPTAVQMTG